MKILLENPNNIISSITYTTSDICSALAVSSEAVWLSPDAYDFSGAKGELRILYFTPHDTDPVKYDCITLIAETETDLETLASQRYYQREKYDYTILFAPISILSRNRQIIKGG